MRWIAWIVPITLGLSACLTSGGPRLVVASGTVQRLDNFYSVRQDCTSFGRTSVRVTALPGHGQIDIRSARGNPAFAPSSPLSACNRTPVETTDLLYTATPGYRGPDGASVRVTYPNGETGTFKYSMTVR